MNSENDLNLIPVTSEQYFCLSPSTKEENFGDAIIMGDKLLKEVEYQLIEDLKNYGIKNDNFKISWDDSCIEGKRARLLDGEIENFSNIGVSNEKDFLYGWIDFIYEEQENIFIVYWDTLSIKEGNKWKDIKKEFGIPEHIWEKIPEKLKPNYLNDKIRSNELPLP